MEKDTEEKSRKEKTQAAILAVIILAGVAIFALLQNRDIVSVLSSSPAFGKGSVAPDFTLKDMDGRPVSLSDYRGRVVLLNIWATWCPPCVEEMPSIERLHQAMKGERFDVLAVSIDAAGADVIRPFLKARQLSFTALEDPAGSIARLYQTTGVPETFIIDRHGIIAEKVIGSIDWASAPAIHRIRKLVEGN